MTGVAALGALTSLVIGVRAQQPSGNAPPPVTFKVETSYVDVDAVVSDPRGNFVRDLTRGDFQLLEDGKPQRIDMFTFVDIPTVAPDRFLASGQSISSDIKSNAPSATGRLFALVLDDLDTTALRSSYVIKLGPSIHRGIFLHQRPGGRRLHERARRRIAGVHQRSAAAACLNRQIRWPEAPVADGRQGRPVLQ